MSSTHTGARQRLFPIGIRGLAFVVAGAAGGGVGCTDEVASEEAARAAYLGLDKAVERGLNLGFAGFHAASSANIPTQEESGDESGTMTVTGQVDQGVSANKGMRLQLALAACSDGPVARENDDEKDFEVAYGTGDGALTLNINLRNIPTGTFSGTLAGPVAMEGDLTGEVVLNVSFSGTLEEDPDTAGGTRRQDGTTSVTGTATSDDGEFAIDLTH
jgi:hypothetical protein